MWKRSELKRKAKIAFCRNYWKSVLVGIILLIIMGFGSGSGNSYRDIYNNADTESYNENSENDNITLFNLKNASVDKKITDNIEKTGLIIGGITIIFIMVIVFAILMIINVFVFNPLEIGCKRFFYRNLNESAAVSNIAYGFDKNYKNNVKTMFFRDLYTCLWFLLFIIPGIVKCYEYRMIPYLLADNPEMTKEEAFATSKRLMDGQKWNAFVLDLSFIGWSILSALTFGILGVLYVSPYKDTTNAALYEALKYRITCSPDAE